MVALANVKASTVVVLDRNNIFSIFKCGIHWERLRDRYFRDLADPTPKTFENLKFVDFFSNISKLNLLFDRPSISQVTVDYLINISESLLGNWEILIVISTIHAK
jgi:hypothetical protein